MARRRCYKPLVSEVDQHASDAQPDDGTPAATDGGATVPVPVRDLALVVGPGTTDGGTDGPMEKARLFGIEVGQIVDYRLVHIRGALTDEQVERLANRLLVDQVDQWWMARADHRPPAGLGTATVIETGLRPGVTDREAAELVRAARVLDIPLDAAGFAHRWFVYGLAGDTARDQLIARVLHNPVIERWALDELPPAHTDDGAIAPATTVLPLRGLDRAELNDLSRRRRLGLTGDEMVAIQAHFADLGREPTDGELETLAQTWSEHCSHKTFRALITTPDGTIDGLLKTYIRGATDAIDAPWIESAFVDNAGIVHFDDHHDLALKAETHNHPSALEPFGGANTGVGGVVRDILGVSAQPIALTDILCFGPEDLPPDQLPDGVLHPRRIRSGVIAGVGDYGNKIGVPNLAGAIFHDPGYTTTPLVFAGCIGLLPRGANPTEAAAGDFVVTVGGAVGRDGVGGATFSSQSMGVETAEVAGSSVQIGDPVVEKGLIDVILAARDAGLYTAITDCGAGGLSSAVGEMAAELGAEVNLALVPRKYPGLAPWEVWLSEAQERMVLAVPDPEPLLDLAARWQVEATVIGRFTGDGQLVVTDGEDGLVDLDCGFLHDGRPRLELEAAAVSTARPVRPVPELVGLEPEAEFTPGDALLALLAHPSLRSNEAVIRTYDHEVLGGTVVRPYDGVELDGPADGTALIPPGTEHNDPLRAAVVGIGAAPLVGRHDCEAMAWAAVDEAVRNAVVAGADPDRLSLLDNFAWGNPTDPVTLGRLVAACRGCHDAALAHGAPFVSGKDSLFNEFVGPDGVRDPVTATLIITAVGTASDVDRIPAVGLGEPGNDIWLLGPTEGSLGGGHLDEVTGGDRGGPVPGAAAEDRSAAIDRHREMAAAVGAGVVVSAHDVAEGGPAVALAEWCFAGRRGATVTVAERHEARHLFGEGLGRYLIEVAADDRDQFIELVPSAHRIGWVTEEPRLRIGTEIDLDLAAIGAAWTGAGADDDEEAEA
jgi:phosphoribosylformylglycinamidine synthase